MGQSKELETLAKSRTVISHAGMAEAWCSQFVEGLFMFEAVEKGRDLAQRKQSLEWAHPPRLHTTWSTSYPLQFARTQRQRLQ